MEKGDYLFTSERLGFRNWVNGDKAPFARMNADPGVMRHFPSTLNKQQSDELVDELSAHYLHHGYTYFAVDELVSGDFTGFIGLKYKNQGHPLAPFTDIGWRLAPLYQGRGYATEGARACLKYGFEKCGLNEIFSIAAHSNGASLKVMKKIGMDQVDTFVHPAMAADSMLQPCHLYRIDRLSVS